jgi:hypothetical protein
MPASLGWLGIIKAILKSLEKSDLKSDLFETAGGTQRREMVNESGQGKSGTGTT